MPTHVALLRGINVGGRFLHTPGGLGRSELAAQLTRLGGSPDRRGSWHRAQLGNREQAAGNV
jgi:hypothetical protein